MISFSFDTISKNCVLATDRGGRGYHLVMLSKDDLHRKQLTLGFLLNQDPDSKCIKLECYPCDTSRLMEVSTQEAYLSIIQNMKFELPKIDEMVESHRQSLATYTKYIEEIHALKLKHTDAQCAKYRALVKNISSRDKLKYLHFDCTCHLIVVGNTIAIPRRVETFFYNTSDDLLQFNPHDIVEVTYQDKSRVQKELRGKTIQYVVNNNHKYKYLHDTKRLALTPLTDGWSIKDIIIIDDYSRFECLMEDLFPVNRRPFYGWGNKEVTIKKIGTVPTLPRYKEIEAIKHFLKSERKTPFYVSYDYNTGKDIINVSKEVSFFSKPLMTSTAAKKAIKFLQEIIEKETQEINTSVKNKATFENRIKLYEEVDYRKFFSERYQENGMPLQ